MVYNPVIGVFYDLENCSTTKEELYTASNSLKSELHRLLPRIPVVERKVYANKVKVKVEKRKILDETGFTIVDAPAGTPDSSDLALILDLYKFALDRPPPSYIFIITGDGDYARILAVLSALGYTIIVIHPNQIQTAPSLSACADHMFSFVQLHNGKGLVRTTPTPAGITQKAKPTDFKPKDATKQNLDRRGMTLVCWDLNSCPISSELFSAAYNHIFNSLLTIRGTTEHTIRINVYGNKLPSEEDRNVVGGVYQLTSEHKPNKLISWGLADLLLFAFNNRVPSNILIISGNKDFAKIMNGLNDRKYNILVVVPAVGDHQTLEDAGSRYFTWPPPMLNQG